MNENKFAYEIGIERIRPRPIAGTWVEGTFGEFRFQALVFPEHTENPEWEIGKSRITKLWLRQSQTGETVYGWNRGLDIAANGTAAREALTRLTDSLAAMVFDPVEPATKPEDAKPIRPHTPGPFAYVREADGCDDLWQIVPRSEPNRVLASIVFWDDDAEWTAQTEANARLFAASPELLEAIRAMLEAGPYGNVEQYNAAVDLAHAAIAKVEG